MADLGQGGSGSGGGGGGATEVTLAALNAKIGALGQQLSATSSSVVISTEQEAIFDAIKTAVEAIDVDTNGIAKDATLLATNGLLTTIDAVLDSIKLDTASIAGKDFATQTTLAALLVELQLKADLTETQPVSAATLPLPTGAATSALQTTLNALITTIDTVLDNILLDTNQLVPVANTLTSLSGTGSGTILAGQKAVSFYIAGAGGEINGIVRPNGWSQTFEYHNNTTPALPYDGNGTATIYIDYLS